MSRPAGFFTSRWRAEVPLHRLFWRDMVLVGTLVNLLATGLALAMAAGGGNMALAATVHFSPLPYNLFLVAALWRLPPSAAHRWASLAWLAWLAVVTLV